MKQHKKKIMKKGIIFLITLFIVILILNSFYINFIEKDKQIFRKHLEWENYKSDLPNNTLDYAFFGDSHTRDGLNPQYINNSFNFAMSGQDYIETYYIIKRLLEKENIQINHFILEIDTHTFSDKMRTKENLFKELNYYTDFISLNEIAELKEESLLSVFILSKLRLIGKGNEIIRYFMIPPKLTTIEKGWTNNSKNFSNENNKAKITKNNYQVHFSQNKNLLEERSINYFIKILELAKKNNISVVFIKYPLTHEYYLELKKNNISRDIYYDRLFTKINETNINYEVIDYYNLFFENPEYFGDSDHLNYKGAEVLSKKVNEDLKK